MYQQRVSLSFGLGQLCPAGRREGRRGGVEGEEGGDGGRVKLIS